MEVSVLGSVGVDCVTEDGDVVGFVLGRMWFSMSLE